MSENNKLYEAPNMRIFQFTENNNADPLLTQSGGSGGNSGGGTPEPTPDYAASALNNFLGGTNTTIEK